MGEVREPSGLKGDPDEGTNVNETASAALADALAEAGWTVHWVRPNPDPDGRFSRLSQTLTRPYSDLPHEAVRGDFGSYEWAKENRYLGDAVAVSCAKAGTDPNALMDEWCSITGENPADEGCTCCGPPHSFEWHDPDTGETRSPGREVTYTNLGF